VRRSLSFCLAAMSATAACAPARTPSSPVSLAVVNARVWTGDERRPWADAVAVSGERIAAVGSSAEIRKLATAETRIVDAGGGMVVPGFIDTHVHFVDGGRRLASVQLRDARTPEEFTARIKAFVADRPRGTWISGQYRWTTLDPPIEKIPVEHAQAELARRWLQSYGPGTANDLKSVTCRARPPIEQP